MSVFLVFALAFVLAVAAKKRWLPGQHWLLQYSRLKKQEHDDGSAASLEIVVDKGGAPTGSSRVGNSASVSASSASYAERAMARKSSQVIAKPPRHEGPASASAGSMEGSIRSALNELRSRQVVKSLCSQFEARAARKSLASSENDDEESCIRAAAGDGDDDEYLLPAQSQQLRRDEPRVAPAPIGARRTTVGPSNSARANISNASTASSAVGSSAGATKGNNLQAFLRRYSSNLDRANSVSVDAPSSGDATPANSNKDSGAKITRASSAGSMECGSIAAAPASAAAAPIAEPTTMATTTNTVASVPAAVEAPPSAIALAPPASAPRAATSTLLEIDLLDLAPPAADDEASNQCDSPVRSDSVAARADVLAGAEQDEPADVFDAGDSDVTPAKQPPLSPEQPSSALEDKAPRAPAVANSVARFQQFQLQIPANHARLASLSPSSP